MAGTSPPKPALVHVGATGAGAAGASVSTGASMEVEVYELGHAEFGSFVAESLRAAPLGRRH